MTHRLPVTAATALVLVVAGCTLGSDPTSGPESSSVSTFNPVLRSPVPAELVGRWNGGSNEKGHWYYEFYPNSTYRAWPSNDNSRVLTGVFSVNGNQITFSNYGSPVTSTWSVSDGLLFLDGFSYVPA
jgi:hypothetical protein